MSNAHTEQQGPSEGWEGATEWPLTVAAVLFLVAYAAPILVPGVPVWLFNVCQWTSWLTWCFFGVDLVMRVAMTDRRMSYLLHHWYDVIVMLLPLLRPLRLLRLIPLLPGVFTAVRFLAVWTASRDVKRCSDLGEYELRSL